MEYRENEFETKTKMAADVWFDSLDYFVETSEYQFLVGFLLALFLFMVIFTNFFARDT